MDCDLQLSQSALEVLCDLVRAAGGAGAAGGAFHAGDGVLSLHALEQAADALQVAVAAADDLNGLDGVVIVQHDVGLLGAGTLVGVAERLAHIQTSSLYIRLTGERTRTVPLLYPCQVGKSMYPVTERRPGACGPVPRCAQSGRRR